MTCALVRPADYTAAFGDGHSRMSATSDSRRLHGSRSCSAAQRSGRRFIGQATGQRRKWRESWNASTASPISGVGRMAGVYNSLRGRDRSQPGPEVVSAFQRAAHGNIHGKADQVWRGMIEDLD
jgi:hypothetical protein